MTLLLLQLNWTQYLEYVMMNTNVTLDFDTDPLMVTDINYLKKLASLISVTDQETLGESLLIKNTKKY